MYGECRVELCYLYLCLALKLYSSIVCTLRAAESHPGPEELDSKHRVEEKRKRKQTA